MRSTVPLKIAADLKEVTWNGNFHDYPLGRMALLILIKVKS